MKRIESLLKIAYVKFEFQNLEIHIHKRQVSFLVVKTVKCKSGVSGIVCFLVLFYFLIKLIDLIFPLYGYL